MTPNLTAGPDVLDTIRAHVDTEHEREVGGFLVGTISDGSVSVEASIPALRAVGHRAQVTFTHEVWEEALELVDRDHPGRRIVGWYHSHPGFGIFLSEYDMFIHRNFFSTPEMVALVVDPQSGEHGWFGWDGEDGIELFDGSRRDDPERTAPTPPSRARRSLRGVVLAAAMVGVLSFAAGYGLAMRAAPTPVAATSPEAPADSSEPDAVPEPAAPEEPDQPAADDRVADDDQPGEGGEDAAEEVEEDPAEASAPVDITYQVRPGDTLSHLAWSFFGDSSAYGRLIEANPDIDDPDVLEVGQPLRIPHEPLDASEPQP